ncbi:MAG: glucosaminidase domain-containing protein [Crocinitomicaceae bacterium]|nr:glucosaminidase domain-containing protein [Crocinitomicaceae bacterium]
MKKIVLFQIFILSFNVYSETKRLTRSEYIIAWTNVAVDQMNQYKIPASITLAQGILESNNGNSKLAINGNNHFGIKCHKWNGNKMFLDDDKQDECFRVYKNAKESYKDHSLFLKKYSRYSFLFDLDITDYKSWARGLKSAGYATNPKYADLLIKIIETEKLYLFDHNKQTMLANSKPPFSISKRLNFHENKVSYIDVEHGDTYYIISKKYGLTLRQLHKFNDFSLNKDFLEEGDIVCLSPKRFRSKMKKYTTTQKMNLYSISQKTGVKLKKIKKLNAQFTEQELLPVNTMIFLK